MDKAEFDGFADEYRATLAQTITASGEGPEYFFRYKVEDLARRCAELGIAPARVLDFGGGIGNSIPYFRALMPAAQVTVADVSERSLAIAAERFPGEAEYVSFDGVTLPFPDATFDVGFAACVFHHIDHAQHARLLAEIRRVMKPGGLVAVFEHNPLNPLTVRVVRDCIFDANARLMRAGSLCANVSSAGFSAVMARYRIFFPRFLRRLRPLERLLYDLPLGAQYCV